MEVKTIWASPEPLKSVSMAAKQTMLKDVPDTLLTRDNLEALWKMGHRSVFEHAVASFHITGVSRSFMAQLRTHRVASFTCSSQHYQDYRDYDLVAPCLDDEAMQIMQAAMKKYGQMVDAGIPKEYARQILPEAMGVNMILTANARQLAYMINLRICRRNCWEMQEVMRVLWQRCMTWFPALFVFIGADCTMGGCTQGKMSCMRVEKK